MKDDPTLVYDILGLIGVIVLLAVFVYAVLKTIIP